MTNWSRFSRRKFVFGMASGIFVFPVREGGARPMEWNEIKQANHAFPASNSSVYSDYLSYYQIHLPTDCEHQAGFIDTPSYRIFTQCFTPNNANGTILLLHGYLDHTGLWGDWIVELIAAGWKVCTIDLPGHGLSTGRRGHISDFSHYQTILDCVLSLICKKEHLTAALGHSTGAAIIADALIRGVSIKKSIFVAPLLKIRLGDWIGFGTAFLPSSFSISPGVQKRTSNPDYFAMRKADPLRSNKISIGWLKAAKKWKNHIEQSPSSAASALLVQGENDSVVDFKYNLIGYQRLFPKVIIKSIPNGRHHLLNEAGEIRRRVRDTILHFVQNP